MNDNTNRFDSSAVFLAGCIMLANLPLSIWEFASRIIFTGLVMTMFQWLHGYLQKRKVS